MKKIVTIIAMMLVLTGLFAKDVFQLKIQDSNKVWETTNISEQNYNYLRSNLAIEEKVVEQETKFKNGEVAYKSIHTELKPGDFVRVKVIAYSIKEE